MAEKEAAAPKKENKPKKIRAYRPGKQCPKCGRRMAEHANRFSCGKCGYAEFKMQDKKV